MRFVVDPHDPVLAIGDCREHLALLSDLIAARGQHGIDFTDAGLSGLYDGLSAVGKALEDLAEMVGDHLRGAWALGRRLHQLGLLNDGRPTVADLTAAIGPLLDKHEAEAKEQAFQARIEQVAAEVRASLPPKGGRSGRRVACSGKGKA